MQVITLEHYRFIDRNTGSCLNDFNFSIAAGEACLISADNPDDAHLLTRALATLIRPAAGTYHFEDTTLDFSSYQNLLAYKRQIGYFGPNAALISNLTVRQNLLLARTYFENALDLELEDNVKDLCTEFQLIDKLDLRPAALGPLDVRAAIMIREFTKPLKIFIMDSPEDLIGHPGFDFLIRKVESMLASGIPLVLLCENNDLVGQLSSRAIRIPPTADACKL